MSSKYYNLNFPKVWRHDLEPFIGRDVETMTEEETDDAFIRTLARFAMARDNRKKLTIDFLDHHFKKTKTTKADFLKHTLALVKANENQFMPVHLTLGYVYDWLEKRGSENHITAGREETIVSKKEDPDLTAIVVDTKKMTSVMSTLRVKGFLDEAGAWTATNIELIALIRVLTEERIIKKSPKAQLGRIFCKAFKCEMAQRTFGVEPKNDTLDLWRKELGLPNH
jgi:hypothetical protein